MVEDTLGHDEPTGQRSLALSPLLLYALQYVHQAIHVVVVIPSDGTAGNLQTLLNGKVDTAICDNDVPALGKSRNYGADGRECLRVQNRGLGTQEVSNILLQLDVDI